MNTSPPVSSLRAHALHAIHDRVAPHGQLDARDYEAHPDVRELSQLPAVVHDTTLHTASGPVAYRPNYWPPAEVVGAIETHFTATIRQRAQAFLQAKTLADIDRATPELEAERNKWPERLRQPFNDVRETLAERAESLLYATHRLKRLQNNLAGRLAPTPADVESVRERLFGHWRPTSKLTLDRLEEDIDEAQRWTRYELDAYAALESLREGRPSTETAPASAAP